MGDAVLQQGHSWKDLCSHKCGLHMEAGAAWGTWAIVCLFSPSEMSMGCLEQQRVLCPWRHASRGFRTTVVVLDGRVVCGTFQDEPPPPPPGLSSCSECHLWVAQGL